MDLKLFVVRFLVHCFVSSPFWCKWIKVARGIWSFPWVIFCLKYMLWTSWVNLTQLVCLHCWDGQNSWQSFVILTPFWISPVILEIIMVKACSLGKLAYCWNKSWNVGRVLGQVGLSCRRYYTSIRIYLYARFDSFLLITYWLWKVAWCQ